MKRLEELAAQHELPEGAARRLAALLDEVAAEPAAISSVKDPAAGADVHVADSLSGLEVAGLRSASKIVDIGAGGGFPGLVLGVALPAAEVTLIESSGRKCDFMRRAAAAAAISNVEVAHLRVEDWTPGVGQQDAVTARAVAPLDVLVEYAAPLLRLNGVLVAYKGRRDEDEVRAGERAAAVVGLTLHEVVEARPFPDAGVRHLFVYKKVRETPERFPRRTGVARKRPLGTD